MLESIKQIVSDKAFQEDVIAFLTDICRIDTTPNPDFGTMAAREKKLFGIIRERLLKFTFTEAAVIERRISAAIKDHPAFSRLHFTKTAARPDGLSPETFYRDRYNLLYFINGQPSEDGHNPALNAHIDVVAPFFPPEISDDTILGRGVIDDKGGVAAIYGALAVLDRLSHEDSIRIRNRITAMFVVEEETGGNGSLGLAMDRKLRERYDSILILECAGNKIYPANRGAVWFWCKTSLNPANTATGLKAQPSPLESMIYAILEMQREGERIKEESNHPMFPHKPVQTCNGILGPFGEHPSRICGKVSFAIHGLNSADLYNDVLLCIQRGLDLYIENYGDKTRFTDKTTGKPRVEKHIDTRFDTGKNLLSVFVYGSTGHMGSLPEHDAAITKWAYIACEVLSCKIENHLPIVMELENYDSSKELILEGGQGFLPTHPIEHIQERMRNAFIHGTRNYLKAIEADENMLRCEVTYDKLHNNAFSCDPDSATFRNAREAGIAAGLISADEPVRGWDVSCDARLFAGEYPGMPVITSGPGELHFAHADNEQLHLPDLFKSIEFLALYLLKETGTS